MSQDVFGNELHVGDEVAFIDNHYKYSLILGTIVRFTPKMIVVKAASGSCPEREYRKVGCQIALKTKTKIKVIVDDGRCC